VINALSNPLGIRRDLHENLMKYSNSLGIPVYQNKLSKKKKFVFFIMISSWQRPKKLF